MLSNHEGISVNRRQRLETHTHAHGVNEHMFVIHICSYLATNQRPCHTRGVHYFSQCHTWVCFTRDCLCVFWQPAREYTWQLTRTWQHVTLLARFDCSTSTHTQVCVCVCYLVSVFSLSTLSEPPGRSWLTPLHQRLLSAESCPLPQQLPHLPRQHHHSGTTPEARHGEHNKSDRESERRRWN